jgi:hypothetical protein
LVFTALVVSAIFATGFGACAYVASQFNFSIGPQRLDPIAVPRTSCPYLRRVHDAAARAGAAWGATHNESDPKAWNGQAASLGRTLEAFELALRGAVPHVPAQIATNLQEVQVYVAVGRTELSRARRGIDYSARTFGTVTSGYRSLSDASDLTGNACGFTLAPNPDVALSQTTVGSR